MRQFGEDKIRLGIPFKIERGRRSKIFKIIEHPFMENAYALIADHHNIRYNTPSRDAKFIINGSYSIQGAYEQAQWRT